MEDLSKLSAEELVALKEKLESDAASFDIKQTATKILMNSLFGAAGNQYFRYYDLRIAESITLTGQYAIKTMEKKVNEFLNKFLQTDGIDFVIAVDTDSVYLELDKFVKDMLSKLYADKPAPDNTKITKLLSRFCNDLIAPVLDNAANHILQYTNGYVNCLSMKREAIASRGFWTAKKRYALYVYDNEGVVYTEPKLKIMGIEVQRSSTPDAVRKALKDAIKIILTENESVIQKYVKEFRTKFHAMQPEDIAFPRGINGLNKYKQSETIYASGTPIQVRGALLHNHYINELGLSKIEPIKDGDKIKFLYLKLPNPIKEDVISFGIVLPKEFRLNDYIDYNTQFQKAFIDPLCGILDAIGWKHEKTNTIEDLFG